MRKKDTCSGAAPISHSERTILARNLRLFRTNSNLNQRELSEQSGIAYAHISEMENAMHNVCIDTMVRLARALEVEIFELLTPYRSSPRTRFAVDGAKRTRRAK